MTSSDRPYRGADAGEGAALAVIVTGLLALVGSVAVQVLWLIAAVVVTVAAAVSRSRGPSTPPTPPTPST